MFFKVRPVACGIAVAMSIGVLSFSPAKADDRAAAIAAGVIGGIALGAIAAGVAGGALGLLGGAVFAEALGGNDLVDDLKLMFNNAMQYNQEGSLIYNVNIYIYSFLY